MTSRSRLTIVFAAFLALGLASAVQAETGAPAGSTGAPVENSADGKAAQPAPSDQRPSIPSGCPYRNGKLELIV